MNHFKVIWILYATSPISVILKIIRNKYASCMNMASFAWKVFVVTPFLPMRHINIRCSAGGGRGAIPVHIFARQETKPSTSREALDYYLPSPLFSTFLRPYGIYTEISMTSLLTHKVSHSTRHSFRPKTNNRPLKKFLSLVFGWVKVVKYWT